MPRINVSNSCTKVLTLCTVSLGTTGAALGAPSPAAEEIVHRTEQIAYYQGEDGRARVSMRISDDRGNERRRVMTILRRDSDDRNGLAAQKYYVYLNYPADVKDTVLMVWKHPDRDDDRWLYLPALDLVKRIAAGDKRTSFLGSDFFYEDISGRSSSEDRHELVETTDAYFVLHGRPKDPDAVEFSSYKMWIHRGSYVPVKVEFLDKEGKVHRVYEALAVETIEGKPTVVRSRMQNLQTGGETTLEFSRVAYDLGLDDGLFSERYLRNPPRRHLK